MKIVYNNILPVKGFTAMNLFGIIFARNEYKPLARRIQNHEAIHTVQMKEMLYIFFISGIWWSGWLNSFVMVGMLTKISHLKERLIHISMTTLI
ncbi:hypothetical protein HMPREF1535_00191 [Parabacteroides goldsteinii DSM 19448 = WAL 12034]|uniref:DUF4157 domain-containing protein n=1 Tax=Parabacteroides goldsteinii DSM 19448 = WAL 12034 TaxID=927665 RepID=A0A0F5JQC2_9BACT|nr:hypothetical protein HMPREF1535_00191 [Parabacteroides goldsteinii DSM 19448 = WAL 12034]